MKDELPGADAVPDLAAETLTGDVRDALLSRFRDAPKPWARMSELEQMDFANGVELLAKDLVRRAVQIVTAFPFDHAVVTLGEVKIKGEKGIEAKIGCANIEHNRSVLGENVGQMVVIYMCDSDAFFGERAPVHIDKEQPDLPGTEGGED